MPQKVKKQLVVLGIFMLMIEKKTEKKKLEQVFCIWYPITFKTQTEVLLNLESKLNVMSQIFTSS